MNKFCVLLILFVISTNCTISQNKNFNVGKRLLYVEQIIITDSLIGYRKLLIDQEENEVVLIDKDLKKRTLNLSVNYDIDYNEKNNSLIQPKLISDEILRKLWIKDTSNITLRLKGKKPFTKKLDIDVYFVTYNKNNELWKGEIEYLDGFVIGIFVQRANKDENGKGIWTNPEYIRYTFISRKKNIIPSKKAR